MPRARILMTLLCGLTLAAAPAAQAADFSVTTTADGGDSSSEDGLCKAGNGQCTLRAALGQAAFSPGADRVALPAGTYQLLDGLSDLSATSTVTVEGAGARSTIIKAAADHRVLAATGNLTLRDVALTGGAPKSSSSIRGGGLLVSSGDATLERVAIYGNTISSATNAGGAGVGVTGGSLTIVDSTISGNTAYGRIEGSSGGSASGGGVAIGAPTVIRRSTITGNSTQALGAGNFSSGGGVSAGDETTLEHVTIAGNTAATYADSSGFRQGGNIYVQGTGLRSIASSIIAGGTANNGPNCFIASGAVTEPTRTSPVTATPASAPPASGIRRSSSACSPTTAARPTRCCRPLPPRPSTPRPAAAPAPRTSAAVPCRPARPAISERSSSAPIAASRSRRRRRRPPPARM